MKPVKNEIINEENRGFKNQLLKDFPFVLSPKEIKPSTGHHLTVNSYSSIRGKKEKIKVI